MISKFDTVAVKVKPPSFFSSKGRMGRLRYALHVTWLLAIGFLSAGFLIVPITLAAGLQIVVLSVKRLTDCGFASWWAFLLIVPFANLAMVAFLMIWPGREEEVFEHERLQGDFKI